MRALSLLLAPLALLAGCVHGAALDQDRSLDSETGRFELRSTKGDDRAADQVARAAERAGPRLAVWGKLEAPVELQVLPDHDALERAIHRPGYGWLRAWARYREVYVQSPRTWSLTGADQSQVDELLTHELTHCLMYQLAASEGDWAQKGIPLWFREGMASYTAEQGYRRGTLEDLARFMHNHPEDPVADADALYQRHSDVVYAAAHQAFTFLIERYGVARVRELLGQMHSGLSFDAAFAEAIGLSRRDFERDFAAYVRLRGYSGRPLDPPPHGAAPIEGPH